MGKWCTGEVLEHRFNYTGSIEGFSRVLEAQKVRVTPPRWKLRRNKLVVLGFGYLASGREAPLFARPRGLAVENVLAEIVAKIGEMARYHRTLRTVPGQGQLAGSSDPGAAHGRAQWRKFHLVHGLHHLVQIRRLRDGGAPK